MNWAAFIIAFGVAVVVAAFMEPRIAAVRPHWGNGKRRFAAASLLPVLILLLTIAGMVWLVFTGPGEGENMQDLALAATGTVGGLFALLTLVAGWLGASVAGKRGGQ